MSARLPRRTFAAALAGIAAGRRAFAQAFPDRPIRMVMPWPPGGGTDILGRALAARMQELMGQPVVVDNRAGGNGIIGTLEAARARPDGYTILMATADTHAINPAVRPNLPYDALRDFAPVLWLTTQPLSLCVHPSVAAASLPEFVALAKAQPGRLTYASWGAGSTAHMAMELFQQRAGIQLTHVPYRGAAPAVSDLVAGQVQAIFTGPLTVNQMVQQGRLRCLATATETRPPVLPDLPTFAESGYAGVSGGAWYALVAPAGVPDAVLSRLRDAVLEALKAPSVRERIAGIGQDVVGEGGESLTRHMRHEIETWRQVVRAANIVVE